MILIIFLMPGNKKGALFLMRIMQESKNLRFQDIFKFFFLFE